MFIEITSRPEEAFAARAPDAHHTRGAHPDKASGIIYKLVTCNLSLVRYSIGALRITLPLVLGWRRDRAANLFAPPKG